MRDFDDVAVGFLGFQLVGIRQSAERGLGRAGSYVTRT